MNAPTNEFVAMLAHELRNPLCPILTAVPVIRRLCGQDSRINAVVDLVERNVEVMARLLEDLLDVSRIMSGKIVLRKEIVGFQTVLKNAADAVKDAIVQKGHKITIILPDDIVLLVGDTVRLEQIFVNLIDNATKYTPDGGAIKIEVALTEETVQTVVTDTGVGIELAYHNAIWDVFCQVCQTLDRPQGGLGLGLTFVRNLVELHGGSVCVTSGGINQGSTFTVTLPRWRATMANNTSDSLVNDGVVVPTESQGLSILLVDDNKDAIEILRMYLQMSGHSVTVIYDGNKAIDAATENKYQVILLDIGLPGASGFEVCETLRKRGCKSYIIAITGYGQDEDKERAKQVGFDRHLTKPVNPDLIESYLATLAK